MCRLSTIRWVCANRKMLQWVVNVLMIDKLLCQKSGSACEDNNSSEWVFAGVGRKQPIPSFPVMSPPVCVVFRPSLPYTAGLHTARSQWKSPVCTNTELFFLETRALSPWLLPNGVSEKCAHTLPAGASWHMPFGPIIHPCCHVNKGIQSTEWWVAACVDIIWIE